MGTARQPARGWLIALNLFGFTLSTVLFLTGAAMTAFWIPRALPAALIGWSAGAVLGLLGLALTRWEHGHARLYFTPNRWLVLGITLVVAARLLYGVWRSWSAWEAGLRQDAWLVSAGVEGSLAAGAVVLGYYVVYWLGVRRRFNRHREPRRAPYAR